MIKAASINNVLIKVVAMRVLCLFVSCPTCHLIILQNPGPLDNLDKKKCCQGLPNPVNTGFGSLAEPEVATEFRKNNVHLFPSLRALRQAQCKLCKAISRSISSFTCKLSLRLLATGTLRSRRDFDALRLNPPRNTCTSISNSNC